MKLAFLGVIAFVSMSHSKIAGIPIISRVIKNKNYYVVKNVRSNHSKNAKKLSPFLMIVETFKKTFIHALFA